MSRKIYLHQIGKRNPLVEEKKLIPLQYVIKNLQLMTKNKFDNLNAKQRSRFKYWANVQNFKFDFVQTLNCSK